MPGGPQGSALLCQDTLLTLDNERSCLLHAAFLNFQPRRQRLHVVNTEVGVQAGITQESSPKGWHGRPSPVPASMQGSQFWGGKEGDSHKDSTNSRWGTDRPVGTGQVRQHSPTRCEDVAESWGRRQPLGHWGSRGLRGRAEASVLLCWGCGAKEPCMLRQVHQCPATGQVYRETPGATSIVIW